MFAKIAFLVFFFNDRATTEIYTLSLHDALPIYPVESLAMGWPVCASDNVAMYPFGEVTIRVPSGLNSAQLTSFMGSVKGWPVCASQTREVPSVEAVTTRLPSGLNRANETPIRCFKGG